MKIDQDHLLNLIPVALGTFALFALPIGLTVWVGKKPHLLSPLQKLITSFLLIALGFAAPFLFFPDAVASFFPTNPVMSAAFMALFLIPQGIVGAGIAGALLVLKLGPRSFMDTSWWWWCVTLCGFIISTYWFLAFGVSFNNW